MLLAGNATICTRCTRRERRLRTHDVTVEKILVQPHVLPGYLPAPKIPQHVQGVTYLVEPPVVGCSRVTGPFASFSLSSERSSIFYTILLRAIASRTFREWLLEKTSCPELGKRLVRRPAECLDVGRSTSNGASERLQECPVS